MGGVLEEDSGNQSVAQGSRAVDGLWVSEVCGEHNLCSHQTLNPHAERVQAEGHVGVNLACPKVGGPPPKSCPQVR